MHIIYAHNTKDTNLVKLATKVVTSLTPVASTIREAMSLASCKITIRITDQFTSEVETYDALLYQGYTTERVGGFVAAITLCQDIKKTEPLVLINSAVFTEDLTRAFAYFPMAIGHEIAHCIIGQARAQHSQPQSYCSHPLNLIDTIGRTARSVCDEFLADTLTKVLLPSVEIIFSNDAEETRTAARTVAAFDYVSRMCNDLDLHIFPAWRNMVQEYRIRKMNLDNMTTALVNAIERGLILSAHYRAATIDSNDNLNEVQRINQHPAMQLYFIPFWNRVGPIIDSCFENLLSQRFDECYREVFDAAKDGVGDIWLALGITFELLPSGEVYVHVDEPYGF